VMMEEISFIKIALEIIDVVNIRHEKVFFICLRKR